MIRHLLLRAAVGAALAGASAGAAADAAAAQYVRIPGGGFTSVLPQGATPDSSATTTVSSFELRATPVTRGEFRAFLVSHPQWQRGQAPAIFADAAYLADGPTVEDPPATDDADRRPVTGVSWFAAQAFCQSEAARLPTWLEWEYAAAADETRRDARADPAWRQRILSWYERPATHRLPGVGGAPNAYGVQDLNDLVWEWVDDFNALFIAGDSRTQGDPDRLKFCGAGAISIVDRDNFAVLMRIALLSSLGASESTSSLGFRCARALPGTLR